MRTTQTCKTQNANLWSGRILPHSFTVSRKPGERSFIAAATARPAGLAETPARLADEHLPERSANV